jgi:hypothetical protein
MVVLGGRLGRQLTDRAPFGGEHENCSRKRAGLGKLADDVASMQGVASRQY